VDRDALLEEFCNRFARQIAAIDVDDLHRSVVCDAFEETGSRFVLMDV
jgi:hypothetical protein